MADQPTINPYAPPATSPENPQPGPDGTAFPHPMFSSKQMLAATLVGSLLAGIILLQSNYRAMARPGDANRAVLFGVLATLGVFAIGFVLPDGIPSSPLSIVVALVFYKLADSLQGNAFTSHRAAGGERQSNWLVFGISVGTLVSVVVILFLVLRATGGLDQLNQAD